MTPKEIRLIRNMIDALRRDAKRCWDGPSSACDRAVKQEETAGAIESLLNASLVELVQ